MTAVTINLNPIVYLNQEQFYHLCRVNPDLKFERNAKGELIIVSPTGGETGKRNAKLTTRFCLWNEQTNLGEVFDSSTCFHLPNGANRSPDVAWIQQERWDALTEEQKEKFPPIVYGEGREQGTVQNVLTYLGTAITNFPLIHKVTKKRDN